MSVRNFDGGGGNGQLLLHLLITVYQGGDEDGQEEGQEGRNHDGYWRVRYQVAVI